MAIRFVKPVGAEEHADFDCEGRRLAYFTPENEAEILAEVSLWRIKQTTDKNVDHDEYGDYFAGTNTRNVDISSINGLSETISYSAPAGEIIVEDGHFVGIIIYVGRNTDRYGYHATVPINSDPHYHIEWPMMRPDGGEVRHGYAILYTDGTTVGTPESEYVSWDDRQVDYFTHTFALIRAEQDSGN